MPKDRVVRAALGKMAVLAAAVPALAYLPAGTATAAASPALVSNQTVAIAARPSLPPHTSQVGWVSPTKQISGAIGLKSQNQAGLNRFLANVTNVRSPQFHHFLARGQYASRFGASSTAISAVTRLLSAEGVHATVSANHILVRFHASAANVERAFGVRLGEFRFADGRTGWGTTSAVRIPAGVAKYVSGVAGLDDFVHSVSGAVIAPRVARPAPQSVKLPATAAGAPSACQAALSQQIYGGVTDDQLAHAYGVDGLYNAGDLGSGQTVAIFELEPFSMGDVAMFDQCYFGASHTSQINVTQIDGGPGTGYGSGEAALDVENVSAIAPDAAIKVYEGSNTTWGSLDTYNQIAQDDTASVVSSSWGLCESAFQQGAPGVQEVESQIFAQAAAQGQSVFSSAGDDGSDDCAGHSSVPVANNLSVDDPASQPYVVAVGGTTFRNLAQPPNEVVWNDGALWGGGGGGISDTWAEPTWQSESSVEGIANAAGTGQKPCSNDPTGAGTDYNLAGQSTTLPSGTPCRLVPDVTGLADEFTGITIAWGGQWFTIGGTSSSTPLWAAMTAEMNDSSFCGGGSAPLGFISPLLYAVASSSSSNYANAFNDITVGNNDSLAVGPTGDEFSAAPGYDLASGLGSPRITNSGVGAGPGLAAQACGLVASSSRPAVTGVDTTSGPVAGGTSVTLTGTDFGASQGSVFFGTQQADVTSWTATSITVTSPAYNPPQGTGTPAAGSAPITVTTVSDVSTDSGKVFHYLANPTGDPVVDYVGPTGGPVAGGNTVDIVGSGFTGATDVTFGGTDATAMSVINDNEIQAIVPAGPNPGDSPCATPTDSSVCQVQVEVTTPAGTSADSTILPGYSGPIQFEPSGIIASAPGTELVAAPTEYDYAPTPTFDSVTPAYGAEEGGSLLDIHGSGFSELTYQWTAFGDPSSEDGIDFNIVEITPTDIWIFNTGDPTLEGPTVEPEAQQVTVVIAGHDYVVPSSEFALAGSTAVTGLSTHFANANGGTQLTISGAGFDAAEEVIFVDSPDPFGLGGTQSGNFTINSDSSITLAVPGNLPGGTDVEVCTETLCDFPNPAVDSLWFGYPNAPVISSISPTSGPASGGTTKAPVMISGSYLDAAIRVMFGSKPAQFENVFGLPGLGQAYGVLAVPPPAKAGTTVQVTVITAGGEVAGTPDSNSVSYKYNASGPSAPQKLKVTVDRTTVHASWATPASNGGSKITEYVVAISAKYQKTIRVKVPATTKAATFKNLIAGLKWKVTVYAVNANGKGLTAVSPQVLTT